jgi:hypothetical protein
MLRKQDNDTFLMEINYPFALFNFYIFSLFLYEFRIIEKIYIYKLGNVTRKTIKNVSLFFTFSSVTKKKVKRKNLYTENVGK